MWIAARLNFNSFISFSWFVLIYFNFFFSHLLVNLKKKKKNLFRWNHSLSPFLLKGLSKKRTEFFLIFFFHCFFYTWIFQTEKKKNYFWSLHTFFFLFFIFLPFFCLVNYNLKSKIFNLISFFILFLINIIKIFARNLETLKKLKKKKFNMKTEPFFSEKKKNKKIFNKYSIVIRLFISKRSKNKNK